jgi:hypothetical protein
MTNETTAAAHRNTVEQLVGPDSRLVYIVGHVLAWTFNAAMLAVLVWLAHDLRSAWPLAAMLFVRGYHHDFNRVRVARPNAALTSANEGGVS